MTVMNTHVAEYLEKLGLSEAANEFSKRAAKDPLPEVELTQVLPQFYAASRILEATEMGQQANPEGPITAAERSRIWSKLHSAHDTFIEKQATEKVERNFSLEIRKATSKNRTSNGATSASIDRNEEAMIMLNGLVAEYIKKLGLVEATEEFLKRALKKPQADLELTRVWPEFFACLLFLEKAESGKKAHPVPLEELVQIMTLLRLRATSTVSNETESQNQTFLGDNTVPLPLIDNCEYERCLLDWFHTVVLESVTVPFWSTYSTDALCSFLDTLLFCSVMDFPIPN
ncbi:unnamed protein product [Ilex paraguariensis]|uniref:LisH domain-containing protein n=1 Tax=Ilex paraguariensis TaxID=185542 RepID=A0ABC8QV37_9AQUA